MRYFAIALMVGSALVFAGDGEARAGAWCAWYDPYTYNCVWIDERCSEEIYSELLARTTATDGIVFLSYTPLKGGGELTYSAGSVGHAH